jgi:hypothetical protein
MELKENEAIIDNKRMNEEENIEEKNKEFNTFKRIKEIQQLIKKKSEMANHCM